MWDFDWNLITIVGIAVATVSVLVKVLGMPDQIRKNYTRKSTGGLSLLNYSLSFSAYALWTWYGGLKHDWPVMLAQGFLGLVVTGIILWQFFLYRKKKQTMPGEATEHTDVI